MPFKDIVHCIAFGHIWKRYEVPHSPCHFVDICQRYETHRKDIEEHLWPVEWIATGTHPCLRERVCTRCRKERQTAWDHVWDDWVYVPFVADLRRHLPEWAQVVSFVWTGGDCPRLRRCLRCGETEQDWTRHELTRWTRVDDPSLCTFERHCVHCGYEETREPLPNEHAHMTPQEGGVVRCDRCGFTSRPPVK
jgi:hypothetical protein